MEFTLHCLAISLFLYVSVSPCLPLFLLLCFSSVCLPSLATFPLITLSLLFCCCLSLRWCREDFGQSISLRSSVRAPPGCRQTGVRTGLTPDPRGICRLCHQSTQGQTCGSVSLQMIIWMFDGDSFSESLRNECPEGFCKLLRRWMIVGVLKDCRQCLRQRQQICMWALRTH